MESMIVNAKEKFGNLSKEELKVLSAVFQAFSNGDIDLDLGSFGASYEVYEEMNKCVLATQFMGV